jgi:hypothetical protein
MVEGHKGRHFDDGKDEAVDSQPDIGTDAAALIHDECMQLRAMLLEKNKNYGNSALDPIRCFSKADTVEQIRVRIDDKLSRIMRGSAAGEDVVNDLLGYLVLLKIAERKR